MKKTIIFDASLDIGPSDVATYDAQLSDASLEELLTIFPGRMYIFFEPSREYVRISGDIGYYMQQIKMALDWIDAGGPEASLVSADYYSNSITFTFDTTHGILELYELNCGQFRIATKYSLFRKMFYAFAETLKKRMINYRPSLVGNQVFRELWRQG